ncbi:MULTISPECIES: hypothetical protein [unclassified Serratia (in: enterobacteria)]|uniref:hypothetical protein n=1 Tax=unclassified Serratia (in: enterobacteria) TaxID=2647522 RepID=UPI0005028564|nr:MULTISPECIES: hypothetical protein [unclassified Serratia (in: enterobacteria)]KFK94570.1 hypothetical protein JV45_11665 [Serratia sp. Ag2]KFK95790.1 hypothetical protein IV04_20435 [Serratia sp. Ag1]
MSGSFLYEFPVELPFLGRSIIYMEEGRVKAVMPLKSEQMVVDMDMMVIILQMAGYTVNRK